MLKETIFSFVPLSLSHSFVFVFIRILSHALLSTFMSLIIFNLVISK
jgi:hypothetical protein